MGKFWTFILILIIGVGIGIVGTILLDSPQQSDPVPEEITGPDYTITFVESVSYFDVEINAEDRGTFSLWVGGRQLSFSVDDGDVGLTAHYPAGYSKRTVKAYDLNGTDESQVSVHLRPDKITIRVGI